MLNSIVCAWTVGERYGDDYIFIPQDAITWYMLNPSIELDTLNITNKYLILNNETFWIEPSGGVCNVSLITYNLPYIVFAVDVRGNLEYNTTYTWYVNATDEHGAETREVYYFTTEKEPMINCTIGGLGNSTKYLVSIDDVEYDEQRYIRDESNDTGIAFFTFQSKDVHYIILTSLGDVNLDSETNIFDVSECWGNRFPFSIRYDACEDSVIDIFDLSVIWGSRQKLL